MSSQKPLITTTDKIVKEGINGIKKNNVVKETITPPITEKKDIDTVDKKEKSQVYNKTIDTPKRNKTYEVKSIDK